MTRLVLAASLAAAVVTPAFTQTPAAQSAGSNTWSVDGAHSGAHFSVRHMMVSTVRGSLGNVSGTITYDGTSADSIKANITIDVTAITTGNQSRDNDLKSPTFFDVAKYPTLTFSSRRVEPAGPGKFRMIGDLTMHGVTKEVTLDVEGPSPILKTPNGAQPKAA